MSEAVTSLVKWIGTFAENSARKFIPFADAATEELPLGRLLRLSLFQVTVGMAVVLVIGTLNRVMIVELGISASVVGIMIALPLFVAPFRALIGFRSDEHKSFLGLRRLPYIALGTMLQFGGFAVMPMALLILSGDQTSGPSWAGPAAAGLAFLLVGAGLHMVQTAGLALATDLAPAHARPKVVALLCVMMLAGMLVSAVVYGALLSDFTPLRLIQVIQGAAVVTILLNTLAAWQQEVRNPVRTDPARPRPTFVETWRGFVAMRLTKRGLIALALGTAAFSMQDVLLEPYGGEVLKLSVAATTALTGVFAVGGICGLMLAARQLARGADPYRVAINGALVGLAAFSLVIFSAPLGSAHVFAVGVILIGFGGGLFAHATLTAAMEQAAGDESGFVLGVWGAVQATAAGSALALGGIIRDVVGASAMAGDLGEALASPFTGYSVVYHIELLLLFATLIAIGPLVRRTHVSGPQSSTTYGLAEVGR